MSDDDKLTGAINPLWAPMELALGYAREYGGTDGAHHKTWVIDQMVRALTGSDYEKWVAETRDGEDGPETYFWDVGVTP